MGDEPLVLALVSDLMVRSRLEEGLRLGGYRLRWVVYGNGNLPLEQREAPLPDLKPGKGTEVPLEVAEKAVRGLVVDVIRPTGFSAATAVWKK